MDSEIHNTHILSSSSGEGQNNNEKTNTEQKLSTKKEEQIQNEQPNRKINIKELFKTILERKEINKVNDLEESNEEEEIEPDNEMIKYFKNMNKFKDKRKNITDNLKDWIFQRKNMKQINAEKLEFMAEKNKNKIEIGTEMSNEIGMNAFNENNENNENQDICNTNKENNIEDINNIDMKEENQENKDFNLNENNNNNDNDNSLNKDLNNNEALSGKINDTNFLDSEISENRKPMNNYEQSNFNFFVIDKNMENKRGNSEDSKDDREIKNQSDDNNFDSSEDIELLNEINNNKKKKLVKKGKDLNNKVKNKKYTQNKFYNNTTSKSRGKKLIENYKKPSKNKYNNLYERSKSNSKNKYSYNNKNKNIYKNKTIKSKENEKNQNQKLKNRGLYERNIKNKNNSNSIKKKSNKKDTIIVRNIKTQTNQKRNKIRTTGNISTKNFKNEKLFGFSSPKNQIKKRKTEIYIPIPRKCYFTKKTITMNKEQFALLNKKIQLMKDKNKIFRHKRNDNNPILANNKFLSGINLYDEMNNKNYNDLEYENNNSQNNYNNLDLSRSNNQRTFINRGDFNNYMNNRLISPNILINRDIAKNLNRKKKYHQKLTDIPLSPYLLNKFNIKQKPLNKSNSSINFFNSSNKKSNKFPTIMNNNHNSLKSSNSNLNQQNDINLNIFKTNTIFNFNPKNNVNIPYLKNRNIDRIQSSNMNYYHHNNLKSIEVSTPISVDYPNKLNIDMKSFHFSKKIHQDDKGYGKHFGNEKDCPICQSLSMKSDYLMKNMNHYNDFIKKRDQNTIKNNKEQFLHELKMPNTKSQKMEANIIREIKHFINTTKKNENMENNGQNDASLINAYFGL